VPHGAEGGLGKRDQQVNSVRWFFLAIRQPREVSRNDRGADGDQFSFRAAILALRGASRAAPSSFKAPRK